MNFVNGTAASMRNVFGACLVALLAVTATFAQNGVGVAETGGNSAKFSTYEKSLIDNIKVDSIKTYVSDLAGDEMEGRGTLQPGGDKAAKYIAEKYKALGLKPLGDNGTYFQSIAFKETVFTEETSFTVGETKLKHGADYGIAPFGSKKGSVNGDMHFVSYAIVADSIKRNDLKGLNVKGKIVVMLEGPPKAITKKAWESQQANQIFIGNLIRQGAKAIVFIGHGREEQKPGLLADYFSRRQISLASEQSQQFVPIPFIYMTDSGADKLFAKAGVTKDEALNKSETVGFEPIDLKQKASIKMKQKSKKGLSANVVGYLEGSDPALKAEAVLFTAHYDAYGIVNGQIYNGAADNALGTGEMMAVAEAFSKMKTKPKRSLIFLAVTAEEYGLYGSKYWAKKPTWDIKKIAGNLNLDTIGSEVYGPVKNVIGIGAEHSTLGKLLDEVTGLMDINTMPDPMPEERVFERSDHYSFVEKGVPALMLVGGPEGDGESLKKKIKAWEEIHYHQPSDDVMGNWVWEGAETVAEVMAVMGNRLANAKEMPSWAQDSPLKKLKRGNKKKLPSLEKKDN